ncbi:MAG: hypothetical protein L3J73_01300, partial [Thermoplasmata archaeon]|nr:hypothetical protein [Thermoplasmata archaeon]
AIPGRKAAERLLARPGAERAGRIGVWLVEPTGVRVLRAARALYVPGEAAPFEEARAQMRALLREFESGARPEGIDWGIFGSPRLPGVRTRSTRDWRLEEFPEAPTTPAAERRPSRTAPPSDQS